MIDFINDFYKNKAFMDFLKRSGVFLIVLFFEALLLRSLIDLEQVKMGMISSKYLLLSFVIFVGCFLVFSRKELLNIKTRVV